MALGKSLSLLFLVSIVVLPADAQVLARGKLKDADDQRAYLETVRQLRARRLTVEWNQTALENVVKELRLHLSRNFVFAPAAADRKAEPVNLELREVTAATLITLIESSAKIRFVFEDGVILVTTPEDAVRRSLEIRVYDIGDLLYEAPDFPGPSMDINPGKVTAPPEESEPRRKDGGEIVDLVRTLVGAEAWDVEGTSIVVSHNLLIVRHTPAVHAKVRELVWKLAAFL
jgi:hypothetical protein